VLRASLFVDEITESGAAEGAPPAPEAAPEATSG